MRKILLSSVAVFAFAAAGHADELSDIQAQSKQLRDQNQVLMKRLSDLEKRRGPTGKRFGLYKCPCHFFHYKIKLREFCAIFCRDCQDYFARRRHQKNQKIGALYGARKAVEVLDRQNRA